MSVHSKNLLIISLLLLLLGLLLIPRPLSAQQMSYVGCFDRDLNLGPKRAAASLHFFQPTNQRLQACLNFCRTGVPGRDFDRVHTSDFQFPAPYSGYQHNSAWCFCGREIVASDLGITEEDCLYKIAVYQPASSSAPVIPPRQTQANQPPRAPSVNPGAWEPPFPLRYEGATQLTWTGNGDPENDPVTYWIEAWWWNAPQGQWSQFIGEWVNEPYFTLTQARGLVPNIYYTWRVAACDTAKRSQPWYAWSEYSMFRTVP